MGHQDDQSPPTGAAHRTDRGSAADADLDRDLAGCIAGEAVAWERLTVRFDRMIRAIVRRTGAGGDDGLVDDLVQEVHLRLARDDARLLRRFDPARARLSTYVGLVARSVTIDHLRRRRLDAGSLDDVPEAVATDAAAAGPPVAGDPDLPEIPRHLLSPRQQLVIRLLFDEDRSVSEAAAILGVDDQTIRSAKHKALTRLRTAMAEAQAETGTAADR